MARRKDWPKEVETAILTRSARRCCLCFGLNGDAEEKRGQIAHVDRNPKNAAFVNGAYLCIPHHDEYDSRKRQSKNYSAEELIAYRERLYRNVESGAIPDVDARSPSTLKLHPTFNTTAENGSTVINAGRNVTYNVRGGRRNPRVNPPAEAIGSNIEMRVYVQYLVGRYIEWRKHGIDRGLDRRPFFPGVINKLLQSEFGAPVNFIPQDRFADVVGFVQRAIDNTIWGKKNRNRN